ncbi:mCG1026196, partial [Mus musculus]
MIPLQEVSRSLKSITLRMPDSLGCPERSCPVDPVFPLVTATTAMQTEWKGLWRSLRPERRVSEPSSCAGPEGPAPSFRGHAAKTFTARTGCITQGSSDTKVLQIKVNLKC